MTGRPRSSDRLRELFMVSTDPLRLYKTEALYHLQVDWTCDLLDIVDEACDEVTAGLIADAIWRRLSGTGASEAGERMREKRKAMEELARRPPAPIVVPGLFKGLQP